MVRIHRFRVGGGGDGDLVQFGFLVGSKRIAAISLR